MISRELIGAAKFTDEDSLVETLLGRTTLDSDARRKIVRTATALVTKVRDRKSERSVLDTFLTEFGLANDEGVALLCLAEALLRIPDARTADALIADKIVPANWSEHVGDSESIFVNASTWGLLLTGKVISLEEAEGPGEWLVRLVGRLGEPVIRLALRQAIELLGREFVLGRTIEDAMARAAQAQFDNVSYDMLGEGARTRSDADRYFELYQSAIESVAPLGSGSSKGARSAAAAVGVSIKLSALHPRYCVAQAQRVDAELYPRLLTLCELAAQRDVAIAIDAEEADRLDLSLDLFERLARADCLATWQGLGIVVQAYGKRALPVLDWLIELATQTRRKIAVRLVKGAYWDAEIKHAQVAGYPDFPVFTRKPNTDISYLVCTEQILAAENALFGQFATHNAHTVAAVMHLGKGRDFEFQRLHGMGEGLFAVAASEYLEFPAVRVYAPVGGHQDLLAYLVRRLLENGANSSFVNRFLDEQIPPQDVVPDPFANCAAQRKHRHPAIRLPSALFGEGRRNSSGLDFSDVEAMAILADSLAMQRLGALDAQESADVQESAQVQAPILNPADRNEVVGTIRWSSLTDVDAAFATAKEKFRTWDELGARRRADHLFRLADVLAQQRDALLNLLIRESGKTLPDADAEIREAIDFCRYYAAQALDVFAEPLALPGPTGETNELSLHGRGAIACISPWNFPLAIFLGQIAGALAAGNTVVAKPAEQTPLIARFVHQLILDSGLPEGVLSLCFGAAEIGAGIVGHPTCAGVAFTGSTRTARAINTQLAARSGPIVPFIAETGGQNAMFVDSSALLEQLTDDVLVSAFASAGQRCSALRVLLLQEDIAERAIELVLGAMAELRLGDPSQLSTDVGPLINQAACATLEAYIAGLRRAGKRVHSLPLARHGLAEHAGCFFAPHLVEIDSLDELQEEHFGPVLHVVRYKATQLDGMLEQLADLGYGLTLGIQSRIRHHQEKIIRRCSIGNIYVNRNIIGAVVGVQPFGGCGMSGTGPKSGGPHYLQRFATERTVTVNTTAQGGNIELLRDSD